MLEGARPLEDRDRLGRAADLHQIVSVHVQRMRYRRGGVRVDFSVAQGFVELADHLVRVDQIVMRPEVPRCDDDRPLVERHG